MSRLLIAWLWLWTGWPPQVKADGAPDSAGWTPIRDDEGITTWESERPQQPLSVFRARALMRAGVWDILAVLEDVNRASEWTAHCEEMRRLPRSSAAEMFVYARMGAPWPVRDRDVVTRVRVAYASKSELLVDIRSVPYPEIPAGAGAVRIPKLIAHYRFRVLSPSRSEVEYQIDLDPGGTLPDWLKQLVAKNLAHDTLARLRDRTRWALDRALYRARAEQLAETARRAGFSG